MEEAQCLHLSEPLGVKCSVRCHFTFTASKSWSPSEELEVKVTILVHISKIKTGLSRKIAAPEFTDHVQ